MGMTMPVLIKTAVTSPKGALGIGAGYMYMTMDEVKVGSDSVDPGDFIKRPGQLMGPKKMESRAEMFMVSYGLTDRLSLDVNLSYLEKKMESYKMGGKMTETTKNNGFGDAAINLRYNVWKNAYYSKFLSVLAGVTLPTGDFDSAFITMPGLQTGTGAVALTGGLLFSQRYKDVWFHYVASYSGAFENSDDYKFGGVARIGAAVHYTPNYNFMAGLEIDANHIGKDRYQGADIGNTGGFRSNAAAVADWKFLTALGGNFSVRLSGGVPIYEDLNHYTAGMAEKVKLGGGYFVNGVVSFKKRFPVL